MPLVTFVTNVPKEDIPEDFDDKMIEAVAKAFNKPERAVVLELVAGAHIVRGGSEKNVKAAHLMVAAGTVVLKADFNRGYANKITEAVEKLLKMNRDHILITFHGLEPANVAAKGETFEHIMYAHKMEQMEQE
ncbi:hypothetical protein PRIPAC_71441 [Pristionchus pacificus]|uniref:Uncharacterized protein n=1 Tax=Pristionchus pacificus TaxID=54126 RepID=A0A2A6C841_PRIPA|nr:hypothetical protein PRIPAC_71441 [Pristionchus pacificus]|eukprot:PDM74354.1 hypothetical protein PRIPAC_41710 [Pristionchus pacificus]